MGGVQSQDSCDNGSPKYSYHERVLQDAEASFSDFKMAPAEPVKSDEQYFSAEEGDSICSLTPERTRPESSSAEGSSDTSDDHDSDNDVDDSTDKDSSRDEAHESSVLENESLVSVDSLANVNMGTNEASHESSHCSFQEQNSVNTDVDLTCARHGNGLVSLEDKYKCHQGVDCSNQNIIACQENFTHSTVIPNPTSQELHVVKTAESNQNCEVFSELKKKNVLLPANNLAATRSSKRKRSQYIESSESDSDDGKTERHRNICKQRNNSRNHNRSRGIHRSSRNRRDSTSDESDCGRKNSSKRYMSACKNNSKESASERDCRKYGGKCMNQNCKQQICQKRENEHFCDKNVANSVKISCCHNIEELKRHAVESTVVEGKDKIQPRLDGRCVHNCNNSSNYYIHEDRQQTIQHAAAPDLTELNCSPCTGSIEDCVFSQPRHRLIVGEQSSENTSYKASLARLQNHQNLTTAILPNRQEGQCQKLQTFATNFKSTPSKEQCSQSELIDELKEQRTAPLSQRLHAGVDSLQNSPVFFDHSSDPARKSASEKDFEGFSSVQENAGISALTNVSTPKSMNIRLAQQSEAFQAVGSSYLEGPPLETPLETTTNNSLSQNRKHKYKEKSAADKFMNLFSAAKKEIGSNIKSLISKVTFTDKSQSSDTPYWQTYLSESNGENKAHLKFTNVQQTHAEPSIKNQFMDGQQAQRVNSPLINQSLAHKLQSTTDGTIMVPPSYSNNGGSPVTSSSAILRNCIYVNNTPPDVATHSDNVKYSNQSPGTASFQQTIKHHAGSVNKCGQSSSQPARSSVEWLSQVSEHQVLNCSLAGAICVSVSIGDLGEQKTSGIVNWTDGALTHRVTSCSRSIASKAGALMWASCVDYIDNKGSDLEAPDVLTTPAGGRFDKSVVAILHVVEPRLVGEDENGSASALVEVYANCLRFANERLGLDSVSFPVIGDRTFPFDICVQSFFDAVLVFLAEQTSSENCDLSSIQLVIPDMNTASFAADLIISYLQHISNNDLYSVALDTYNHHFGQKRTESIKRREK